MIRNGDPETYAALFLINFCVNIDYVVKIEGYCVTLVTGEVLSIPGIRYTQIREALTALIEKGRFYREKTEESV